MGISFRIFIAIGVIVLAATVVYRGNFILLPPLDDAAIEQEAISEPQKKRGDSMVVRVVDGDTVELANGEHVRLLGIDTDELGEPCFEQAREFLSGSVLDKKVFLEKSTRDRDDYGRLLRYLFVGGTNVNISLVEAGHAEVLLFPDNRLYHDELIEAEERARTSKRGCEWKNQD